MNPDITGCDARNQITDIRCGLPEVVWLENGDQYCEYCATMFLDADDAQAFLHLKRAGLV